MAFDFSALPPEALDKLYKWAMSGDVYDDNGTETSVRGAIPVNQYSGYSGVNTDNSAYDDSGTEVPLVDERKKDATPLRYRMTPPGGTNPVDYPYYNKAIHKALYEPGPRPNLDVDQMKQYIEGYDKRQKAIEDTRPGMLAEQARRPKLDVEAMQEYLKPKPAKLSSRQEEKPATKEAIPTKKARKRRNVRDMDYDELAEAVRQDHQRRQFAGMPQIDLSTLSPDVVKALAVFANGGEAKLGPSAEEIKGMQKLGIQPKTMRMKNGQTVTGYQAGGAIYDNLDEAKVALQQNVMPQYRVRELRQRYEQGDDVDIQ